MVDFSYQDMLPLGPDDTPYRLLTTQGVSTLEAAGRTFLVVEPEVLTLLTGEAMRDIAHLFRPGHLEQLSKILDDPEASDNDRFVALELLKNAVISSGGVLPSCQDTGTAIIKGKKGQFVLTGGGDEAAIARGVFDTYQTSNLRYSQMAPITMYEERNTGNNLPAEIEIAAVDGSAYSFLFMAKGGGSANKSYLYQETKALLNPTTLLRWVDEKIRTLGTAACPPYHLAIVIGGTSAEHTMKTAKLASARYLDSLPTTGNEAGRSVPSSVGSTSATTCGSSVCPATERRARSPSPCRARPIVRRRRRSPPRACSSSSSRPTRRTSCPRSPTTTSTVRSSRSTSPVRWTRSGRRCRATRSAPGWR